MTGLWWLVSINLGIGEWVVQNLRLMPCRGRARCCYTAPCDYVAFVRKCDPPPASPAPNGPSPFLNGENGGAAHPPHPQPMAQK